jgi:ribose/xylose/arabinose/galactoside ABC-type transport system permease subunit
MDSRRSKFWALLKSQFGSVLALVLVFFFFAIVDAAQPSGGRFLSLRNLQAMLISAAPVVTAALGMTVVIISGGIDLSVGTAVALCATVMAWVLKQDGPIELALICCLLTGCAAGSINGLMISTLKVAPFIVTLGTMTAYLGIAKLVAEETTVRPPLENVPGWLSGLAMPSPDPEWLIVAPGVWGMLLMAAVVSFVLRYTVFGRHVFALGSNERTASLCGLNIPALKLAIYTVSGLFVGLAGIYQFAKLKVGNPISGIGLELKVIAAVVIGGASLSGGRGSVLGTVAGALLMQTIVSGCTQLGVTNPVQDIILGAIIVAAVTVDQIRRKGTAE